MFKSLTELFEKRDKKLMTNLITAFALGILLIMSGSFFLKGGPAAPETEGDVKNETPAAAADNDGDGAASYETRLEQRLKSLYETVEGAGRVSVMVTLSYGKEIVIAEDSVTRESGVTETDSQGGKREQYDRNSQDTTIIITGKDGTGRPLILKEIEPKVEGVVIVAQGGDNVLVKDALIRATQTVLGVEAHRVQVLKMRS